MEKIECQTYPVYFGNDWKPLKRFLESKAYSNHFVLVDENTERDCLPILTDGLEAFSFHVIRIPSGEINKNIDTCNTIWKSLVSEGADRSSVLINLGGGVIGDMGGYCASCYMRGIDFVLIPTTLLSQVDSSIGSKLGIDFDNYKNLVGLFNEPEFVFVDTRFLNTLSARELVSGFAELIKHALIADQKLWKEIFLFHSLNAKVEWESLVYQSVLIKKRIVEQDPKEKGLRKILNFGHTIGHAIESLFLNSDHPLLHGEAIALGMACEAFLSNKVLNLREEELNTIIQYLKRFYPLDVSISSNLSELMSFIAGDKKVVAGKNQFSLLEKIGQCQPNVNVSDDLIAESISFLENLS